MFTFSHQYILFLFILVVPVFLLRHVWRGRGGRVPYPLIAVPLSSDSKTSVYAGLSFGAWVLFWLSLCAFIIAGAGPTRIEREEVYLNRGADIVFVLDESPSMAAQDFQPGNRFEAAKEVIRAFIKGRKNNHIGLVTFGKEAELQIPPTKDYTALTRRLETLKPGRLGDETAIGLGLGVACAHIQNSDAPKRIIILLTDGENNAGNITPMQAARIANAVEAVVYTCGIGRQGETLVEFQDPDTGEIVRGRYESFYDELLLRNIAELTGGLFFTAPNRKAMSEMFDIIDRIETEKVETGFVHREYKKYKLFLLPGLLLFLISCMIRYLFLRELLI